MKSKEIQIFGQYLLSKFCYTFPPLFSGIYFINQTLIFFCNLQLLCAIRFSNSRYIYVMLVQWRFQYSHRMTVRWMSVAEYQRYFIAQELISRYSRWYVNSEKQYTKMWSKCLFNSWLDVYEVHGLLSFGMWHYAVW